MLKRTKIKARGRKKRGQSTVEYILLVAAVLGALIYFLAPGGIFQNTFNATLQSGTNGMERLSGVLADSHQEAE